MSELHTYRITFAGVGCPTGIAEPKAFTAADALTQWREVSSFRNRRVLSIEPLPDAPTLEQAQAEARCADLEAEILRLAEERRRRWNAPENVPAPEGLRPKAPRAMTVRERVELLEALRDIPRMEVSATAATRASCRGPATGTARAATPEDRIGALEAALMERTAERDAAHGLLAEARRHREELISAIYGPKGEPKRIVSPDDAVEAAARIARETREERDGLKTRLVNTTINLDGMRESRDAEWADAAGLRRQIQAMDEEALERAREIEEMRQERDALVSAILVPSDGDRTTAAAIGRVREVYGSLGRARDERDALACAAVGQDPGVGVSMVDVERVVRDLGDLHARDKNRRAALNEIAAVVWPGPEAGSTVYALADLVEAVRKMGAERDAFCAQVERQVIALRDGQRDKADLRSNIQAVGEERDALQKRIDAAKAHLTGANLPHGSRLLAILEGREP